MTKNEDQNYYLRMPDRKLLVTYMRHHALAEKSAAAGFEYEAQAELDDMTVELVKRGYKVNDLEDLSQRLSMVS